MEIKVVHACGTKFVFDIEPENGVMPFAIQCPSCGADATEDANAIIAHAQVNTVAPPAAPAQPKPSPGLGRPPATAAKAGVPPPPPPPPKPGLSLGSSHAKPAPAAETKAAPAPAPAATPAAAAKPLKKADTASADGPHLPLAITGAVIDAVIGMGIWYAMIHFLHFASGWVAWGVGVLAGFGARTLGRTPTQLFGIIAAVCALLGILGGSYLALSEEVESSIKELAKGAYEKEVAHAKKIVEAKDDVAILAAVAEQLEANNPTEVPDALIAKAKADLPRYKDLVAGKPTKAEYEQQSAGKIREMISMTEVMKDSFGLFSIIFILLGLSSAYKIGSGMGS